MLFTTIGTKIQPPQVSNRNDGKQDGKKKNTLEHLMAWDVPGQEISKEEPQRVLDQHGHHEPRHIIVQCVEEQIPIRISRKQLAEISQADEILSKQLIP
jgi:hypothetical protein